MGRLRKTFILYINWLIMTETRKAIIELIEPYMEKELSIWLLYKDKTSWEFEEYTKWQLLNPFNIINNKKVLWIYDITAVLKYIFIEWISKYKLRDPMFDNANIHCEWVWLYWKPQFIIPNKSLHLYIEQEEKDLLDLLLKLK